METSVEFKLAELFCGPGGLGLGAVSASLSNAQKNYKIKPVWANDIDGAACGTYARNLHEGDAKNVVCSPIQEVILENIPKFDGLAFGFPCNDFIPAQLHCAPLAVKAESEDKA